MADETAFNRFSVGSEASGAAPRPSTSVPSNVTSVPSRPQMNHGLGKSVSASSVKGNGPSFMTKLTSSKGMMLTVIVLQVVIIAVLVIISIYGSPAGLVSEIRLQMLINKVASATTVNRNEKPVFATVSDAPKLREGNAIDAEVYKDAVNGDSVLAYTDKMIIYRESENKIIYEGKSPGDRLTDAQIAIVTKIVDKAKIAGIKVPDGESPQLAVITDVDQQKVKYPKFYANAVNNDILAYFATAEKVVIYRQSSDSLINTGDYKITLQE